MERGTPFKRNKNILSPCSCVFKAIPNCEGPRCSQHFGTNITFVYVKDIINGTDIVSGPRQEWLFHQIGENITVSLNIAESGAFECNFVSWNEEKCSSCSLCTDGEFLLSAENPFP